MSLRDFEHYKIESVFYPDYVQQIEYISDAARGLRRAKVERRWKRHQTIGEGGFGSVWLERDMGNLALARAVKTIKKSQIRQSMFDYKRELKAMAEFSKPKYRQEAVFVDFLGWYDNDDSVFLATEYFAQGDLERHIKDGIPEEGAKQITVQVLRGLSIMHREEFTHRDLKPSNIFVVMGAPEWWVKIGDFGISKRAEAGITALRTFAGTRDYMAPEFFPEFFDEEDEDEDEESSEYTQAVDMWALGCIVYKMATGKVPFPSSPNLRPLKRYCRDASLFPEEVLKGAIDQTGIEFVRELLASPPSKRLKAAAAQEQDWLQTVGDSDHELAPVENDGGVLGLETTLYGEANEIPNPVSSIETTAYGEASRERVEGEVEGSASTIPIRPAPGLSDYTQASQWTPATQYTQGSYDDTPLQSAETTSYDHPEPSESSLDFEELDQQAIENLPPGDARWYINLDPARKAALGKEFVQKHVPPPGDPYMFRENIEKAMRRGKWDDVLSLLDRDLETPNLRKYLWGALYEAETNSHYDVVELLINKTAELRESGKLGGYDWDDDALHMAASDGNVKIGKMLLEKGWDPDKDISAFSTPLYLAIRDDHLEFTRLLLQFGASTEIITKDSLTPLALATFNEDTRFIKLLLDKGANIEAPGEDGMTALHNAINMAQVGAVRMLIARGADLHSRNEEGQTALHIAVLIQDLELTRLLIEAGASRAEVNNNGETPLELIKREMETYDDEVPEDMLELLEDK